MAGPHHRLNILSLPERYALLPLVHLSSLSMLLFPFATIRSSLFLSHMEESAASSRADSLSPPDFFFSLLSSFRTCSPSRASPYPPFLLARLTKMGPAASGSRFPRKLSSYKINYPPYFIAPRRSGPGCAST